MSYYVNPANQSKETWLANNGRSVPFAECRITEEELPVCLVQNPGYTAAGIADDEGRIRHFSQFDGREKQWFMVKRTKLQEVSDYTITEKSNGPD
jgi:hypothetical protein